MSKRALREATLLEPSESIRAIRAIRRQWAGTGRTTSMASNAQPSIVVISIIKDKKIMFLVFLSFWCYSKLFGGGVISLIEKKSTLKKYFVFVFITTVLRYEYFEIFENLVCLCQIDFI